MVLLKKNKHLSPITHIIYVRILLWKIRQLVFFTGFYQMMAIVENDTYLKINWHTSYNRISCLFFSVFINAKWLMCRWILQVGNLCYWEYGTDSNTAVIPYKMFTVKSKVSFQVNKLVKKNLRSIYLLLYVMKNVNRNMKYKKYTNNVELLQLKNNWKSN